MPMRPGSPRINGFTNDTALFCRPVHFASNPFIHSMMMAPFPSASNGAAIFNCVTDNAHQLFFMFEEPLKLKNGDWQSLTVKSVSSQCIGMATRPINGL